MKDFRFFMILVVVGVVVGTLLSLDHWLLYFRSVGTPMVILTITTVILTIIISCGFCAAITTCGEEKPIELKDKKNKKIKRIKKEITLNNGAQEKPLFHKSYISFEKADTNSKFYKEPTKNLHYPHLTSNNKTLSIGNSVCICIGCQRDKAKRLNALKRYNSRKKELHSLIRKR